MTSRMAWLRDVPALWRSEPTLTGRVGGALYTGAGVYALLLLVLPGTTLTHPGLVAPLGAASVLYGLLSLFVLDWRRLPAWVLPAGTAEAIPDGAAILAVADAFDVMTATRIYSAARSREDALTECERLVGAQFAPAPVAALVAMCRAELTPSAR